MKDEMNIGATPCEEDCAQVGSVNYEERAKAECRRYIERIRAVLGPEPEGARLRVKSFLHDFGTYYEVVCVFDTENAAAVAYAYRCESEAPTRWTDEQEAEDM